MRRLITIITTVLLGIIFLTSCARKPEKVRIGYIPHDSGLPFFVAVEKGYFKEEDLAVDFIKCGFREYMDALVTGRVDLITPTSFPYLFGIEAENPGTIKFFLPGGEKINGEPIFGILVSEKSSVNSTEDLRGKKIGVTSQIDVLNLKLILSKLQLDPEREVSILQVSPEMATNALIANKIDVLFISQPYLAIAIEKTGARLLVKNPRAKYIVDPYWSGAAAVLTRYAEENPKIMKRVLKALDKAVDFIRENGREAKDILPKYTPLPPEISQKTGIYFTAKSTEPIDMQKIQKLADLLAEYKILERKIETPKMYLFYKNIK